MSITNFISKGLRISFGVAVLALIFMLVAKINHLAIFGWANTLFLVILGVLAAFIIARAFVAVKIILS